MKINFTSNWTTLTQNPRYATMGKKKGSIITLAAKIVIDLLAIQNDIRSADQPGRPRHEPVNHKVEWS